MKADPTEAERALDVLLRFVIEHPSAGKPSESATIAATPFVWRDPSSFPTRAEREVTALLRDPVGAACRQGIRRIGEHLFKTLGGTAGMSTAAENAAAMDLAHYGRRASILDHAWDGIGTDADWWCC